MAVVGVDGCHAGWFAVWLADDGSWDVGVFKSIGDVVDAWKDISLMLVDIPIGLRNGCNRLERLCDMEARRLLGSGRASSVFPAPCREALCSAKYEEASRVNKVLTGRGLSRQSWAICGKIAEVDQYVRLAGSPRVREVHPEVCFWALNGKRAVTNRKKSTAGLHERLRLLRSMNTHADAVVCDALITYPRTEVATDDILDALAAAVTALGGEEWLRSIPECPEVDSAGLRMEMVYRELPTSQPRR